MAVAAVFILIFSSGCGLIARMSNETPSEKNIAAEFNLAGLKDKKRPGLKILVVVKQPAWLGAPLVLQQMLTEQIIGQLTVKAKIRSSALISYKQLSEFRSKEPAFYSMTEEDIAKKLGADVVLLVVIDSYSMLNLADSDLYKATLAGKAVLIEAAGGKKLWPEQESKMISVGFDMEQSQELSLKRLSSSFAHCLTRYLYNCPYRKFKTADDSSGVGWQEWEK